MGWLKGGLLLSGCITGLLHICAAAAAQGPVSHGGAWEPEYVLVATAQNITIDCESRYSVVFNGTSPGPVLHLQEGKTTWVRVYNQMTDKNITTHWHGLSQRTAPFSDGTPLVSQWPIAPGNYFDYEIHPEVGDAGTYFYHSHVGFQAVTAHGALIVDEADGAKPPYDYDGDIPILVSDYYRKQDDVIEAGLVANPFVWMGEPNAVLVNGRSGNAPFGNATGASCQPHVITVEPGKTYRLRFTGGTALSFVMLGIEDHAELTIIEADGQYTKPATTDRIQMGSGQRFSALLKTKTEEQLKAGGGKASYWIRYETRDRPSLPSGYALLQYKTTSKSAESNQTVGCHRLPDSLPATSPVKLPTDLTEYTTWMEYTLESLAPKSKFPTLAEVTRTVVITMNQAVVDGFYNGSVNGMLQWDSNNLSWQEAKLSAQNYEPYLVKAYKTGQTPNYDAAVANGGWDPATKAFPARVGEVLDIVWQSNSGPTGGWDVHPMHAHGEHFWDLGSGNGTYDAAANERAHFGPGPGNSTGYVPALRDTTQLYRYAAKGSANHTAGWRAWRIRVTQDNVGAWMMHCHVLGHMVMGMQTVWVFGGAADMLAEIPAPYVNGYLDYGGDAYGNDSYDPLVVPWFGKS
ncbi:hypothetical protein PG997_003464 [Apiospora hydei]|uniref:L-ascorbate oxidase n=1 Tax=Apiospora hydei TaxID=1337664 RepID=A0ABR1WZC2_9PEZI